MIKIKNAMASAVKGVIFDYGGVIENLHPSEAMFQKGVHFLQAILEREGIEVSEERLSRSLKGGQAAYEEWYEANNLVELPNERMWTNFFLRTLCSDPAVEKKVESMSEELSSIYEFYLFRRRPAQSLRRVLKTLYFTGYTIALVSNTISRTLIPERLKKFDVDGFFSSVVLSVDIGVRKPRREIFEAALERAGLRAQECMHIGDTVSRDVEGAKNAGIALAVLIHSGLTGLKDRGFSGKARPDETIDSLTDIFRLLE
jgi:putative hydrolase of the HAD superfamily